MVIYIQYKFHELPSIGYIVLSDDEKMVRLRNQKDGQKMDGQTDNAKPIVLRFGWGQLCKFTGKITHRCVTKVYAHEGIIYLHHFD